MAIKKARIVIKSYLWSKSDFLTWTWLKLTNCCLECKKGGLGSINLKDATNVILTKWILLAFQLGEFNLNVLLCHNIVNVQPSKHQRWLPNMQWNLLSKDKQVPRSKLWNEVIKSWKHILTKLKYLDLANFFFILHCNLLWTSTFHTLKFGWSIERGVNLFKVWLWEIKGVWDLDANKFVPWNVIVKIYIS
jgi:hypothetical protein